MLKKIYLSLAAMVGLVIVSISITPRNILAQISHAPPGAILVFSTPSGSCLNGPAQLVITTGLLWSCQGGTWTQIGSGGGGGAVSSVNNSNGTLTVTPTTGAVIASLNLANSNVWTANGAASSPGVEYNGSWYTAGTGTTNFPYTYINCNGSTQPTTWNTSGVAFGINSCSGFAGFLLDLRTNGGASMFSVDHFGAGIFATNLSLGGNFNFIFSGRSIMTSPANGIMKFTNNAATAAAGLQFGSILGQSAAPTVSISGSGCALGTPATGSNNIGGDIPATGSSACTAAVITLTWSGSLTYTNSSICPDIVDISSGVAAHVATKTTSSCTWAPLAILSATDDIQYGPISGR